MGRAEYMRQWRKRREQERRKSRSLESRYPLTRDRLAVIATSAHLEEGTEVAELFYYKLPLRVEPMTRQGGSADVLDSRGEMVAAFFPASGDEEDGIEHANGLAALFVEAAHKKAGIA